MAEFTNENALGISSATREDDDLDLLIGATTPANTEEDNDLDDLIGGSTERERVQNNLAISRDISPEQAAKDKALGDRYGLPVEAVEQGRDIVEQKAQEDDLDTMLGGNAATSRFLTSIENARVAQDSIESLGVIERVVRGYHRGVALNELGYAGLELRARPQSEDARNQVKHIQRRLEALGQDTEGFVSALAGVAEFFGQRMASGARPEALQRTAIGAAAGGTTGLAGGPFAPVTVPVGTAFGSASGYIAHQIMDVGEVEAGLSYVEQLEEGVDPGIAYWTSLGVGVVNAGLELVGGASFLRPLNQAGKKAFREGLRGVIRNPKFREAVSDLVVNYSLNVGTEVATEIAQEVVNIAAEELGKELTEGKSAEWTPEEWTERLTAIGIKTLKTTAILAAPGNTYAFVRDVRKERSASRVTEELEALKKELDQSPLTPRSPKQAAQHVAEVYSEEGVRYVYIPVEELDNVVQGEQSEALYDDLGVRDQVEEARSLNGDVRVSVETFSEKIIQTEQFNKFKDHVKFDPEELTKAQSEEQAKSRDLDEAATAVEGETISRDITYDPVQDRDIVLKQLGLENRADEISDRDLSFAQLASNQRGRPEIRMREVQNSYGGGVLSFVVEHVGDITHRASEKFEYLKGSYSTVKDKVDKTLKTLTHGYGFEKEHLENIQNYANNKGISFEDAKKAVDKALKNYADEHRKLRVYNDVQFFAREAAVALGEQDWNRAISYLEQLQTLTDNEEVYNKSVAEYFPDFEQNQDNAQVQELAEHEMGMKALFDNASDAGMTEPQYASYLETMKRVKERAIKTVQRKNLKRAAKRVEKKYLETRGRIQQEVEQSLSQEPLYQAFLAIGRERLDRAAVLQLLNGDSKALLDLPTSDGRRIYTPQGQKGLDPKAFAELYGYEADVFLFDLMDAPSFEEAVQAETTRRMEQEQRTLLSEREKLDEAIRALATDKYAEMMAFELARIRQRRGQKRIRLSLVRARAKDLIQQHRLDDINPRKYESIQKREARRARIAVREGDWDTAAKHKLNQLLALEMMKESYRVQDEVKRGNKFMKKFVTKNRWPKTLPLEYLEQIQTLLGDVELGPRLSDNKRKDLMAFAERKAAEAGVAIEIPAVIVNADKNIHYRDMPLQQWRDLHNTVRSLDKIGRDENVFRNAQEKATVSKRVSEIADNMRANLKPRNKPQAAADVTERKMVGRVETLRKRAKEAVEKYGVDFSTFLLNTDSLLRNIDGFKDLGVAYKYIKGGIDRAITEGYLEGHVGYVARNKQESQKMVELFDHFSKAERFNMWVQEDIPGVRRRMSRGERIAVLLNMGNQGNIDALTAKDKDGNQQFTEEELEAIRDAASEKELNYAQAVWDYLDGFYDEVKEAHSRRFNKKVDRVEPLSFEARGKTYRGGYYPIRYDTSEAIIGESESVENIRQLLLTGGFSASHTRDYHTKARTNPNGAPIKLDPFVLNNHVQQVIYDLEVGDAVIDAYKVLHNKDLKETFTQMGLKDVWDALDIWLGDVTAGELHKGAMPEKWLRGIRTGTTISAMGFNVGVAALQPLGLIQSSVQVGHRYMVEAVWRIMEPVVRTGDITAPYKLLQEVTEMSGFMRERERSFNKDIVEAQKGIQAGFLSQITPGRTSDHIGDAFFLFIAKAQRLVDFITWTAAYQKGLQQFDNDQKQAVQLADRMVARSQGSGNFQERTMVERGTLSSTVRQSEIVRSFSLFLNYFAAKLNVAYERTKKANFTPMGVMTYAVDMALLFVVEGFLAALIKEGWPDDEDDDRSVAQIAAWEGAKGVVAGIPFARELPAAIEGFPTGGAWGSFINRVVKVSEQTEQGGVDDAFIRAWNSLFGILFRYPSTQMNKTGDAIYKASEGEDIEWFEYLTGPRYDR